MEENDQRKERKRPDNGRKRDSRDRNNADRKSSRNFRGREEKNFRFRKNENRSERDYRNHEDRKFQHHEGDEFLEQNSLNQDDRKFKPRDDKRGERGFHSRDDRNFKSRDDKRGERGFRSRDDRKFRPRDDDNSERGFRGRDDRKFKSRDDDNSERGFRGRDDRKFKPRDDDNSERGFRGRDDRKFKPRDDDNSERGFRGRDDRKFKPRDDDHSERGFRGRDDRKFKPRDDDHSERSFRGRDDRKFKPRDDDHSERKYRDRDENKEGDFKRKRRDVTGDSKILSEIVNKRIREGRQAPQKQKVLSLEYDELHGPIRLNKYISNAGICSRREADTLIATGAIMVNNVIITEMGYKVMPTDEVRYGDKILQREKPVYLLLNKPKDYITTTHDELDRKDVMLLIKGACKERIYPVGRLDKNTTGLLLFTNDGELTKKLTHPKHNITKIYAVELNKNLTNNDFNTISDGIELEDGMIKPDEISYINDSNNEIGITIHSGRNRIVRRIFESLGYEVTKLDRVVFAGLTKKDLRRGEWRFLTESEVNILKMISVQ